MRTALFALLLLLTPVVSQAQFVPLPVPETTTLEGLFTGLSADPISAQDALDQIREWFDPATAQFDLLAAFTFDQDGNLSMTQQEGVGNEIFLDQAGAANVAVILQRGDANKVSADQQGDRNVIGISIDGSGNVLLGDAGDPGVLQLGNDNIYVLEMVDNDVIIAPAEQIGDGNQAVQTGVTPDVTPFGIQQFGSGMRLIIRHNPIE